MFNKPLFSKEQAQTLLNLVLNASAQVTVGQVVNGLGLDDQTRDLVIKLKKLVGHDEKK